MSLLSHIGVKTRIGKLLHKDQMLTRESAFEPRYLIICICEMQMRLWFHYIDNTGSLLSKSEL